MADIQEKSGQEMGQIQKAVGNRRSGTVLQWWLEKKKDGVGTKPDELRPFKTSRQARELAHIIRQVGDSKGKGSKNNDQPKKISKLKSLDTNEVSLLTPGKRKNRPGKSGG